MVLFFLKGGGQVRVRFGGTGDNGGQGSMATLAERHMLTGAIRGVVGGMSVIRGHSMPERAPCRSDTGDMSETRPGGMRGEEAWNTHDEVTGGMAKD